MLEVGHSTIQRDLDGLPTVGKPPRPKGGRPKGSSVKRRKQLYEEAHPETKQGKLPGKGKGKGKSKRLHKSQVGTFVNDTAAKTGKSRTSVARDATRGNKLGDDLARATMRA